MTGRARPADTAEDLLEDAPCGYLSTDPDGLILRVNRTLEQWTGRDRAELVGGVRFQELLSPGGQIYHETHYAPMLRLHGVVREIAVDIVCADGTRLPALVNSVLVSDGDGRPAEVRTVVFAASDRRRYEEDLLAARRREEEVARRLQRSLLADDLPAAEGWELGFAYRAGEQGLVVGGDWYDAFWVQEGRRLALVVGDVVGRGLDAAATMGQLRSAVRALASTGAGPAEVLRALDAFSQRHGVGQMATVVYAELDVAEGLLRLSSAGHLPAVLAVPGTAPALVWEARSLPLDAHPLGAAPRSEAEVRLPAGACVVLYTDGLVERREERLDDGLARLVAAVGAHRDLAPADLADELVRELLDGAPADDVCVMVARAAS